MAAVAGRSAYFAVMDEQPEKDEGMTVTLVRAEKKGRALTGALPHRLLGLESARRHHDGATGAMCGLTMWTSGTPRRKTVLHDVSLYAEPGQKIAFVGSTGAGKTTITNLINPFYDINAGTITYDGIDVRNIEKNSLRRSLGMVLQDTHLFTGTIAENIRYGRPDATDEQVVAAARLAGRGRLHPPPA